MSDIYSTRWLREHLVALIDRVDALETRLAAAGVVDAVICGSEKPDDPTRESGGNLQPMPDPYRTGAAPDQTYVRCASTSPHGGFSCTLDLGHKGEHAEQGMKPGRVIARWDDPAPTPEWRQLADEHSDTPQLYATVLADVLAHLCDAWLRDLMEEHS